LTGCSNSQDYRNISQTVFSVCSFILPKSNLELGPIDDGSYQHVILRQHHLDIVRVVAIAASTGVLITTPFLLLVAYLSYVLIRYLISDLRYLPEEMAWSYLDFLVRPWKWDKQGSTDSWFYFRDFQNGSKEWNRVRKFFDTYLDGSVYEIEAIKSVYNPNLTTSFLSTWNTRNARREKDIFKVELDDKDPRYREREYVADCFKKRVEKMSWNQGKEGNWIVPVVHGTAFPSAISICESGFAALGTTDSGFFGKGIYFTTYAFYSIYYIKDHNAPALIISWVLPGTFLPFNPSMWKYSSLVILFLIHGGFRVHLRHLLKPSHMGHVVLLPSSMNQ